jgi:hypothetical protein
LECLTMVYSVDCPMEFMLQRLQSYRRLRKLSIITMSVRCYLLDDTIVQPLSCFLRSSVPLKSLELNHFRFSREYLVPLLHAMRNCSTLVRLALIGDWEIDAAHEMAALLRQPRESSLRELCLGGREFSHDVAAVMTSILTPPKGCSQRTSVASLLRVFELDSQVRDIAVLVAALTHKRSQITTLSLRSMDDVTSRQLARCLPDMTSLRILTVRHVWGNGHAAPFLRALRRNGSVQRLSFRSVSGWASLGTVEKRRVQSYCDRNRYTRGLLQKLEDADVASLSLCPLLLHAAKPAWRMAPSAFLGGLIACNEAIGPRGHAKRIAS